MATSALALHDIDAYYGDSHVLQKVSFTLGEGRLLVLMPLTPLIPSTEYTVRFRQGVSFQDLTVMLSTAAEGMALRAMVDPTGIIDMQARTSLLGKLALALMLSCVDPGDGMPLEQIAKAFTPPDSAA